MKSCLSHIIILMLCTTLGFAQAVPANLKANRLLFYRDSSAWVDFFTKLKTASQAKSKPIKIAHFGGSHVQAGIWTNEFITQLQSQLKTQGGGYFAFPYAITKTNGQAYAEFTSNGRWKKCRAVTREFCLPLGVNGMSAITNDSVVTITIKLTDKSSCKQFNMLRVYHNFNPSFECKLSFKDKLESAGQHFPEKGFSYFGFEKFVDSLQLEIIRKDTLQKDFILYGFSIENTNPGIYAAGLGVNGAASNSFLKCNLFDLQLQSVAPDMAIISLGVNDVQAKEFSKAEFMANYDTLIQKLKVANPNMAILLTTTSDNYVKRKTPNKRTMVAQQAFYELALKHKVAVWDLFEVMGGYRSINKWIKVGLAKRDRVHFTGAGYRELGKLMFDAFWQSYRYQNKIK
jgi:lysophospholipase L1-like esterase